MAAHDGLLSFPIRTRNKGSGWKSSYDDIFDSYIDFDTVNGSQSWQDVASSSSTFDDLFPGLHDDSSQHTHSSTTSEIKLLNQPHPSLQSADDSWTKTLKSFEKSGSDQVQDCSAIPTFPLHDDYIDLDTRFSSLPYTGRIALHAQESRGRTRTGAQQGSIRGTRNPSGVRKSLRHTRSTPNMMDPSRYRPNLGELLRFSGESAPPVPVIDQKWSMRQPVSPPTSTEMEHPLMPSEDSRSDHNGQVMFPGAITHHGAFMDPAPAKHTPIPSPMIDSYFEQDDWPQSYNDDAVTFNTISLGTHNSYFERVPTLANPDIPTPPSFNPWIRANSRTLPSLALDASSLRHVPPQVIMSAPLTRPTSFGLPGHEDTPLTGEENSAMVEASISPRTTTFPTVTPNFSLPYRSQRAQSPQHMARIQQVRPGHIRAASELPSAHDPHLSARRTRSSSRPRSSRHHRRTKSGPGTSTDEALTTRTPKSRGGGISSQMNGFVNLTPSDSEKLLTGVAPSGSSKTKARREKEAQERRRRLSQAAVKAVRDGDLNALKQAGLVLEDH
ncbi:Protein kinase byr2 [Sphaceloma murrayae]|uniref:Protein kinase byr2 n=1 Tax=Sphaceloma murrayae TaxID=2082308 RepID=A0A2K1QZ89_9PEZI|nr:Protein kinase byr2 [Sphaceloma murrayae]